MTRIVPDTTINLQRRATTPDLSSWVSANAGSGKTYVLARRIIRLMLAGAQPSSILALTFTKTAAAEMAIRVQELLGAWALKSDDELRKEIEQLEGYVPGSNQLLVARRLFAQALETPGGLKIQTIHAFAERILHQFPIEANLPMRFEVLEENAAAGILKAARESVFMRAELGENQLLSNAYEILTRTASDHALDDIINQALRQAPLLREVLKVKQRASEKMAATVGLTLPISSAGPKTEILNQSILTFEQLKNYVPLFETGGANDKKLARELAKMTQSTPPLRAYCNLFLTKDGAIPKRSKISKKISDDFPEIAEIFKTEAERVHPILSQLTRIQIYEKSVALLEVMDAIFAQYETSKRARAALDFDDLIFHLKVLLSDTENAAWVHYKLDAGIDHILVDEAQDTNPDQWRIIDQLAREFFTGDSANLTNRTLFAVGDEKQSIYSFQGARPEIFDAHSKHYARLTKQAGKGWEPIKLILSFRSAPEILQAVDHIFDQSHARQGLSADSEKTTHEAWRKEVPGLVEVWPLEQSEKLPPLEQWPLTPPQESQQDPVQKLANRIAEKIAGWLRSGKVNPSTGEQICPSDILILLQTRGPLFHAIIRALKAHDVPLAGADRLELGGHIAVQDLLVLAQAMLTPNDDLAVATLLRSPLIDLSEDQLFTLCYQRKGTILSDMQRASETDATVAAALDKINHWRGILDFDRPFEFFSHILATGRVRKSFFARLGYEADEVLAEFLNLTLAYERTGPATLQGFLDYMARSETVIKREQSADSDAARVMTVHGAKGLEASIVFLADAHRKVDGKQLGNLFQPNETEFDDNYHPEDGLLWLGNKSEHITELARTVDRATRRQEDEYHRLLYVAMTRAENQLYICGLKSGQRAVSKECWHDLIWQGLEPHSEQIEREDDSQSLLRFTLGKNPVESPKVKFADAASKSQRPIWLDLPAPEAKELPDHISPSRLDEPLDLFAKTSGELSPVLAREQGSAIHALLQYLPQISKDKWQKSARVFLEQQFPDSPPELSQQLWDKVGAVLENEDLAFIFGKNALAEINVTANAIRKTKNGAKPVTISGQIDRLLVEKNRVLIVDFKSNAIPPETPEEVPKAYLVQLGLYALMVGALYPDRLVETALLWTSSGNLMQMPCELTQEAVSDFTLA